MTLGMGRFQKLSRSSSFRDFLRHEIPAREIIVCDYRELFALQRRCERLGIVVRQGWEYRFWRGIPFYDGDESYPSEHSGNRRSIPTNYRELYVTNCRVDEPHVTALPRGIHAHRLARWRLTRAQPNRTKTRLAYCNFSLGALHQPRYLQNREAVYQTLKERSWISFENMGNRFGTYDLSPDRFYRHLSEHRFTISPEGNGVDCNRTWEALYLKSVPIVQRSPEMEHFRDLPLLFTQDYSELTPEYLNDQYARILDNHYDFEKLYLSYWKRRLLDAIERHSKNAEVAERSLA